MQYLNSMGKQYDHINEKLRAFIEKQHLFFVATAPLSADGHINLSPRGLDSLRIIDDHTVAFYDLIGSGVETIAHLKENRRIIVMFCAFEGAPNILRLHGHGDVIEPHHDEFEPLAARFTPRRGLRALIRIHCTRISDSCGFGVPRYEFIEERPQLIDWADGRTKAELVDYQLKENAKSIDGLNGVSIRSEDAE